jgi:hypothetical protein
MTDEIQATPKDWIYNGKPITEPPEGYIGFIYLIYLPDGRKYVGKKLWSFRKTKQVKGKKKKYLAESDWKTYFGSSDEVKELVKSLGPDKFEREILHLCKTKGEMNYMETWEIFKRQALLNEDYVNGWVTCKIHQAHVIKVVDKTRL